LKVGDVVSGYDLTNANLTDDTMKALKTKQKRRLPEVILVRKTYARRNRAKNRQWKLRQLKKETSDRPIKKGESEKYNEDMEKFMQDIEEDPELRSNINLYRNKSKADITSSSSTSTSTSTSTSVSTELKEKKNKLQKPNKKLKGKKKKIRIIK